MTGTDDAGSRAERGEPVDPPPHRWGWAAWTGERARRRADVRAARRNRAEAGHCFYCGIAFTGDGPAARTADHRLPRARGGTDGLANLVFACRACNERKADADEVAFVASAWLRARRRAVASSGGLGRRHR